MNADRRKRLTDAVEAAYAAFETIQGIADEEREAYDNMPESLQSSDRGEKAGAIADNIEAARDELEAAIESLRGVEA